MVIVCKYTHMHIYIYNNHTMNNHIANTYTHLFNLNKYIFGGLKSWGWSGGRQTSCTGEPKPGVVGTTCTQSYEDRTANIGRWWFNLINIIWCTMFYIIWFSGISWDFMRFCLLSWFSSIGSLLDLWQFMVDISTVFVGVEHGRATYSCGGTTVCPKFGGFRYKY